MNIERDLHFAGVGSNKTILVCYMIIQSGVGYNFSSGLHLRKYLSVEALLVFRFGFGENSYGTFIRKLQTFLSCRKEMGV
ncbi:hypothetical protein D3C73_1254190 [compost metagenome]